MPRNEDIIAGVEEITPFLRSILAFLSYMRFGAGTSTNVEVHYHKADEFLSVLKNDLTK